MNRLSPVSLSAAQPHKAASPSAAARCNQGLVGDAGHVGRSLAQAEQRGAIDVKGNGEMRTWFLNGRNR